MKIVDVLGNVLTERPDYTQGRLLQDRNNPDVMVFSTWKDIPPREEEDPDWANALKRELAEIDAWYDKHHYIAEKIAYGRATRDEYAEVIAETEVKAQRVNEIRAELAEIEREERARAESSSML